MILDQLKAFDDTDLDTWYDLSTDEKDKFIDGLTTYASSHQEEVKDFIQQLELKESSCLTILYEALFEKIDIWGAFIVNDIERLFQLVKTNQIEAISLDQFDILDYEEYENKQQLLDQILNNFHKHLNDTNYEIRYYAVQMLSDCLCSFDHDQKDTKYIKGLQARLKDDHWKVRMKALDELETLEKIPANYKPSLLDKVRRSFVDYI